ncbi:MAG TPA: NAD(P)-binding domain-containing protein [Chloroflexaceae bacterium]|nr:NAD(P)-binding domain-containing protein [Chloroflexaceae bacterium]
METSVETIVIGAGQSGLAAGYHLQRGDVPFLILEASDEPGGSWPHYYDSLRLFSPARFSSLPGLPFPREPERYPARDEVIAYLRGYAAHFQLPVITGVKVEMVSREGERFHIRTADGRSFQAQSVIAATGAFHRPFTPQLPGQEQFRGRVLHSFAYRTPAPFAGQRVVVVGGGNSAVQIAAELAKVARVSLAVREPVRFVTQRPYGRDVHWWWSLLRFDTSPLESLQARLFARLAEGKGPRVLDAGVYRQALAAGEPDARELFSSFTKNGVLWADGQEEAVDTVIFATGYQPNLDYLAPLGALDDQGQPKHRHGVSTSVSGLGFVGLSNQRTFASAALRGVGPDAAVVLRALQRQRRPEWGGLRSLWRGICCPAGTPA